MRTTTEPRRAVRASLRDRRYRDAVVADAAEIEIRRATADDRPEILSLLAAALGWESDDRHAALFAWKHDANPFGVSLAWVAGSDGRVLGFRTFMRWDFLHEGVVRRAVRAVDTATHPDARGRGLFRTLTLAALDDLRAEGIDWVFNTPNEQSRPGYLKMGWFEVGRLPLAVRPRLSISAMRTAIASRASHAELWPVDPGDGSAARVLAEWEPELEALLAESASPDAVSTARTLEYLHWRYGLASLGYRAVCHPDGVDRGVAFFRPRRRGHGKEVSICDVLTRRDDRSAARALVTRAIGSCGADFAAAIGSIPSMATLRGRGPMLTGRAVSHTPPASLAAWRLTLGDVELF